MKKPFVILLLIISAISLRAQTNRPEKLQNPEQNKTANQNVITTATLTNSSRLFASKDDLTTVMMIIPSDSVVIVLDADSTYLHVVFEDNEGYIFNRHVILNRVPVKNQQSFQNQPSAQQPEPALQQQESRYSPILKINMVPTWQPDSSSERSGKV